MFFQPTKTLFGTCLLNSRKEKVKASDLVFLESWKPVIDRKTMKIGFENIDPRKPNIPAGFDSFTVCEPNTIITRTGELNGIITQQGEAIAPEFPIVLNYGDTAIVAHGTLRNPTNYGLLDLNTCQYIISPIFNKIECVFDEKDNVAGYKVSKVVNGLDLHSTMTKDGKTVIPLGASEVKSHMWGEEKIFSYHPQQDPQKTIFVTLDGKQIISTSGQVQITNNILIASGVGGSYVYECGKDGKPVALMHSAEKLTYLDRDPETQDYLFKQTVASNPQDNSQTCYVINQHKQVLSEGHDDIKTFNGDYFKVINDGYVGLISRKDYSPALDCEFDEILTQYGRPSFASKEGLWGVLGTGPQFDTLIPYEYTATSINQRRQALDGKDSSGQEVCIEIGKKSVHVSTFSQDLQNPVTTESVRYREM